VERSGDQFLPRAALARDQDGRAAVGDLFDLGVDVLHRRALADQIVKGIAADDLRTELFHLSLEFLVLERPLDDDAEFFHIEGFRDIVGCAELHRIDGGFDRFCSGQHDDRRRSVLGAYGLEYRQPVGAGQDDVEEDQMGGFLAKQLESLLGVGCLDGFVGRFQHSF